MPVKPDELFDRMVLRGKGSYCFGHNGLFLGMLRGLGYRWVLSQCDVLLQMLYSYTKTALLQGIWSSRPRCRPIQHSLRF